MVHEWESNQPVRFPKLCHLPVQEWGVQKHTEFAS